MINLFSAKWQNMVLALGVISILSSCEKEEISDSATKANSELIALNFINPGGPDNARIGTGLNGCNIKTVKLVVGQSTLPKLGEVSIYKNEPENKLYVTLSIDDNTNAWFISKTHLFIGAITTLGIKKNPAPGQFPENADLVKP